jgi:hypothetical protein
VAKIAHLIQQRAILNTGMSGLELTLNCPNGKNRVPLGANQERARRTTIAQRGAQTTSPIAAMITLRKIITSVKAMRRRL